MSKQQLLILFFYTALKELSLFSFFLNQTATNVWTPSMDVNCSVRAFMTQLSLDSLNKKTEQTQKVYSSIYI